MQQYRNEDILQAYYPHTFTFNRDDVIELNNDNEYDIPEEMCDPEKNELFLKSKVYIDESEQDRQYRYYRNESPRKKSDWRSDAQDYRIRQDDVRLRDRHYKKKEKKREEFPVWALPPKWCNEHKITVSTNFIFDKCNFLLFNDEKEFSRRKCREIEVIFVRLRVDLW